MQSYLSTNDILPEKENQYIADIFYSLTTNIHEQEPLYGIEKNIDKKRKRAKSVENYIDALIKNVVYLKKCCEEFWNIVEIIFAEESIANAALIELQIADIKESIKNECNNNPKILINYKEEFEEEFEEQSAKRNNLATISSQLEELEFQYCFFFCHHILTLDFIVSFLCTNLFDDYLKNYYSRKPFNVYRDIFKAYTYQYSGVISGQWKYVSSVEIDDKDNGEKNLIPNDAITFYEFVVPMLVDIGYLDGTEVPLPNESLVFDLEGLNFVGVWARSQHSDFTYNIKWIDSERYILKEIDGFKFFFKFNDNWNYELFEILKKITYEGKIAFDKIVQDRDYSIL